MSNSPNITNDKIKTTAEKHTQSSPQPGASGYVELERSDLSDERIERLGHYLSDTTKNNPDNTDAYLGAFGQKETSTTEIPHTSGKTRADYVISAPFGGESDKFEDDMVREAFDYFKNISKETATFDEETISQTVTPRDRFAESPQLKYGSGHKLLNGRAQGIVEDHITKGQSETMRTSRWAGVGNRRFPAKSSRYQPMFPSGSLRSADDADESTQGTRFNDYTFKTGDNISDTQGDQLGTFWDSYFSKLEKFGPALQKTAANQSLEQGPLGSRYGRTGSGVGFGGPDDPDRLNGTWQLVDMANLSADSLFENFSDDIDEQIKINKLDPTSTKSFGQHYSPDAKFSSRGFTLVDNSSLATSAMLLEIFLAMSIRVLLTTAILEIANFTVASISGIGGPNPFDNNYYPPDPQRKNPTDYKKGRSGFRHSLGEPGSKANAALMRAQSKKDDRSMAGVMASQLLGGATRKVFNAFDQEVINFSQNICRELNLYIPKHHLSQVANATGYSQEAKTFFGTIGKGAMKVIDIGTSYTRACAAGFAVVGLNILSEVDGRSLGYYKTLFREIVRSNAMMAERRGNETSSTSVYDSMMHLVGEDDKLMKFMNYLCIIGDVSVATGAAGRLPFPENDVPIDLVGNHPMLRTATTRLRGTNQSRLSLGSLPSLMLAPADARRVRKRMEESGLGLSSYGTLRAENDLFVRSPNEDGDAREKIGQKYQPMKGGRFTPEQVRLMEDQLEAEHMPFYIQDLRTNEIIAFHAFLNSLSDSYTGEWSAQKGFGRLEAAQIYGGGSRSISLGFTLVAMNPDDFDEMYTKINKLTTLVYPQWSEGTLMQMGKNKFVQPFSQVPTASPLCRIRVGEIFASNYSKQAMARMMGIGNPQFQYEDVVGLSNDEELKNDDEIKFAEGQYYLSREGFREALASISRGLPKDKRNAIYNSYAGDPTQFRTEILTNRDDDRARISVVMVGSDERATIPNGTQFPSISHAERYLRKSRMVERVIAEDAGADDGGAMAAALEKLGAKLSTPAKDPKGIIDLFSNEKNPIFKSFESTMGRGIAVAINSIGLEWKLNSAPWNMEVGSRAPRMCEISLGLIPIHDITPGLDHKGINRAPIYKVGSSRSLTGDVWYDEIGYEKLKNNINDGMDQSLAGDDIGEEE